MLQEEIAYMQVAYYQSMTSLGVKPTTASSATEENRNERGLSRSDEDSCSAFGV